MTMQQLFATGILITIIVAPPLFCSGTAMVRQMQERRRQHDEVRHG
ncbi:hypothetical protein G6L46_10360 [Agrobacterium rhizogenes]|nr:hypothetical protein [Rhizobium rhizogenes]NTF87526.1 hypothetical protein [Rhizobium rhizogenes]